MPCGQSYGCDGRCKVAPFVCPDWPNLGQQRVNQYNAYAGANSYNPFQQQQQLTLPNASLYDYLRQQGIANAPRTPVRQMTAEDLGLRRHDWNTSEGRKAAIWEQINVASDPTARKLELMRCRLEQVLPIITSKEFSELWKRCESIGGPL